MDTKRIWMYSIIGMLTTIVVLAFARLSFGVILPFMREGLVITYKEAGILGTAISFGYVSMVVFSGVAASKWGSKRTIIFGTILVSMGFIGIAMTPGYWVAFVFMIILGVGTAFTYTPLISLLVAWFPLKRGLVIGLTTSGVGIGILLSGIVIPFISTMFPVFGWRYAWGLFALCGIIVIFIIAFFIENPPVIKRGAADEKTVNVREIYRDKGVINVSLIYGVVGVAYIIQMVFVMSFMIESGISSRTAGQFMALNGFLSIFTGPVWGHLSDKIGRKKSLNLTMAITLIAMMIPVFYPTFIGFTAHIILISCTLTGLFTLVQAATLDQVKPSDMPVAFSYATFYFAVGQLIGPVIAGWLIEDFGGFTYAFLFSSICLGAGFILSLRVKNRQDEPVTVEGKVSI
ncbi:MFS transporter [Alkalihalophilus pseudofirmus]|uniref:MFS transporter n=1 Tax=Alkalihalophilus pseudofirmus TaxID=79885 RepID=UPI00259B65F1|nr:MFS transporter [Alkalihalophilus pseudofirmus]WEG15400.1 MFS transporter [Alkalihalophilus pseudofirmus]